VLVLVLVLVLMLMLMLMLSGAVHVLECDLRRDIAQRY
jgi:hypothetical protein